MVTVSKSKLDSSYNYMLNDQLCWGKKRKRRSPLSQRNKQAVSRTAETAQRNSQATVPVHDCWLCMHSTHSSGFTEGFSFLDHLFFFPLKESTDCYQQEKKS